MKTPEGNTTAAGLAIIAGSGLGDLGSRFAENFPVEDHILFQDIDGVGACTVPGHRGTVSIFRPGKSGYRRVALVLGRRHVYEGERLSMASLIAWLAGQGIGDIIVLSAAGSVTGTLLPGELVVISSVIDLQNRERLQPSSRGTAGESGAFPGRGPILARPRLSARLIRDLERSASRAGVALGRATLACAAGPAYESPAEVRALQVAGADVATMSAAPEVQYALRHGMDAAVIAAVTNSGTGIGSGPLDHGHVLEAGGAICGKLGDILIEFITRDPNGG